jgi:S-adenosylmethionine synthetase
MKSIAESVSNGHPDKVADIVADALVDKYMELNRDIQVGFKVMVSRELVLVSGEVSAHNHADIEEVVRGSFKKLGYDGKEKFDGINVQIIQKINYQPSLIPDCTKMVGAPDQCFVTGYATNQTKSMLPLAVVCNNALQKKLEQVRNELEYLRADAKTLVVVKHDSKPRVESVVLSTEHAEGTNIDKLRNDIEEMVIGPVLKGLGRPKVYVNPIGEFVNAGPYAETGFSGRKVVVDGYGNTAGIGGGAKSGKDPYKMDRGGSYMARHIAKCLVANDFADECIVNIAYAIGISNPISVEVKSNRNNNLVRVVQDSFDLSPKGIVEYLKLRNVSYEEITKKGHFHESNPWENVRRLCK